MKTIVDFAVEAAIRKGAPTDLAEKVSNATSDTFASGGINYKVEFWLDEECAETFSLYGDGTIGYDGPSGSITAKVAPLHSKTWIRRMVKSGMVLDYAKQLWAEYYSIRWKS